MVMERIENLGDLDLDVIDGPGLPRTGPVSALAPEGAATRAARKDDSSILELPSAEFEQLDPSRLVDIPQLADAIPRARPNVGRQPGWGSLGVIGKSISRDSAATSGPENVRPNAFPSAPTHGASRKDLNSKARHRHHHQLGATALSQHRRRRSLTRGPPHPCLSSNRRRQISLLAQVHCEPVCRLRPYRPSRSLRHPRGQQRRQLLESNRGKGWG